MASLNRCTFIGRLGADPEVRAIPSGDKVANFSIAISKKFKTREGNDIEKTEWINIVAWRKLAEIIEKYVFKGSELYLEGEFTTRKWEDREGNKRYSTEIIADKMQMLSKKNNNQQSNSQQAPSPEDDLPF